MEFAKDTPTRARRIGGFDVEVPQPYTEGQPTTAGEASALNQTLAENVSNNLRTKLEKGNEQEDGSFVPFTAEEAQAEVVAYLGDYEMGVRSGGGRISDPIEREAMRLATEKAKELVKAKGLKIKDVDISDIAGKIYAANEEQLTKLAKRSVAAQEKAAAEADSMTIEGLDI